MKRTKRKNEDKNDEWALHKKKTFIFIEFVSYYSGSFSTYNLGWMYCNTSKFLNINNNDNDNDMISLTHWAEFLLALGSFVRKYQLLEQEKNYNRRKTIGERDQLTN